MSRAQYVVPCVDAAVEGRRPHELVLIAFAALDQAGITPRRFSDAYTRARGKLWLLLDNLDVAPNLNGDDYHAEYQELAAAAKWETEMASRAAP